MDTHLAPWISLLPSQSSQKPKQTPRILFWLIWPVCFFFSNGLFYRLATPPTEHHVSRPYSHIYKNMILSRPYASTWYFQRHTPIYKSKWCFPAHTPIYSSIQCFEFHTIIYSSKSRCQHHTPYSRGYQNLCFSNLTWSEVHTNTHNVPAQRRLVYLHLHLLLLLFWPIWPVCFFPTAFS